MNGDDLRWLLQTIETPEMAERFVLAQYKHGRISDRVIAALGRERLWITQAALQSLTSATHRSTKHATTETHVDSRQEHLHECPVLSAL